MADHGIINNSGRALRRLFLFLLLTAAATAACSSAKPSAKSDEHLIQDSIPRSPAWKIEPVEPPTEPKAPAFVSVPEEIIPLKTKIVNIVVRNSSLGDVLHILADASGLNLLVDRDVPLDQPMTLALRNATAEDAMKAVFSSADCFYTITNNVLKVESVGTKVFELGHPALINNYTMDVGGNISGAGMNGSISASSRADSKAHDFWGGLESSLNSIMDKKESTSAIQNAAEAVSKITNRTKAQQNITINRLTGTILVTATRKNLEKVEQYLDNVRKVLNRQVMIEARIIEVQLSDGLSYGIDWSFLEAYKELGNGTFNAGFGKLSIGNTTLNDASAMAAGASKFQVGVTKGNFQGLLSALKTQGDIKTLSNPKINVMNGHTSILTVGTNTSFISKVTTTTTGGTSANGVNSISFTPETTSVLSGMIIGIVPFIAENGDISLNITPITSDLVSLQEKTYGSAGNQVTISIPTVALREMTTTVKMRDGQMAIIGGLISKKESSNQEKVPLVGDIPYLGKLFTRTNNQETRSELVLLLRPHVIDNE